MDVNLAFDVRNSFITQENYSIRQMVNPLFNFKILILGEPAVGKTSLVKRFVHATFTKDYLLTIGVEPYIKYAKVRKKQIAYTIFDVAGQKAFNPMRKMFYTGSKGTIIVFDLTRRETFDKVETWLTDVKKVSSDQHFILVGNKVDLKKQRKVKKSEANKLAKKLNFGVYIETSALTGTQVDQAFNKLGIELFDNETSKKKK